MTKLNRPPVAVVGVGHWGKNLARNFGQLGALAAVCDPDFSTAQKVAAACGAEARGFDEVLSDTTIAGIAIAAPAELHASLALQAFAAGKHVYVEKPLALTRQDGEAMIEAGQAADRLLMVGHLLQYHPAFQTLRQHVENGVLGSLRYVTSHRLSFGKFRRAENALWSFAPHDLSMILSLFGETPATVQGRGTGWVTPGVEDECRVDMTFEGGGRAHVFASWLHPFKEHRLVAVGSEAMMVFEDSHPDPAQKLRLYRHRIDKPDGADPVAVKSEPEAVPYPSLEPLNEECNHFLACIEGRHTPRTDGVEALGVLDALLRAGDA
jgi:UDP-2-acetamido-3-amino-2,3-dideoxy-glucuronate N-acetyltransferase